MHHHLAPTSDYPTGTLPAATPETLSHKETTRSQPKQMWKPSTNIQQICTGEGTVTGHTDAPALPHGLQNPTEMLTEYADDSGSAPEYATLAVMGSGLGMEPHNEHKARASPDWPKWENTMNEEITQLMTNNTWELVERPLNRNVVGCHWTYRLKQDANGKIIHHKARLVAQGFTQAPGINYNDTFAPIAKLTTN